MSAQEPTKTWIERLGEALLREPQTQEQLVGLLHDAKDRELLDPNTLNMIESVLGFSELQARDVMIPRGQMVVIEHHATPNQALPLVIETAHSRFPVINENHDEIIGVLLAKDLLPLLFKQTNDSTTIETLVRPTTFVPESKRLDALL
jgi:magnesium and cobalt transporter